MAWINNRKEKEKVRKENEEGSIDFDSVRIPFEEVDKIPAKKEFLGNTMKPRTKYLMEDMSCLSQGQRVRVPISKFTDNVQSRKKLMQKMCSSFETAQEKLRPFKHFEKYQRGTDLFIERLK